MADYFKLAERHANNAHALLANNNFAMATVEAHLASAYATMALAHSACDRDRYEPREPCKAEPAVEQRPDTVLEPFVEPVQPVKPASEPTPPLNKPPEPSRQPPPMQHGHQKHGKS